MATGLMDRKRVRLLRLLAVIWPLIPVALAPMAQGQEEPPRGAAAGFPNGGLLGGNPFGPSQEERDKAKRDADDWTYRPRNVDKFLRKALGLAREGKYEKALAWAEGAVRCDPEYVKARMARGRINLALNRYRRAIQDLDLVVQREPDRKELYVHRGFARVIQAKDGELRELELAEADARKTLEAFPNDSLGRGVLGLIAARRGDVRQCIAELTWAIDHGSDIFEFRLFRGVAYDKSMQFDNALVDLDKACQTTYLKGWACLSRARFHARRGNVEQALGDYKKAIDEKPRDVQLACERLPLAFQSARYDIAKNDLSKIAEFRADAASGALFLRSLIYLLAEKNLDMARSDLDRAIKLEPSYWFYYASRAVVDFKRKEYARTIGDVALSYLMMGETKFEIWWKLEKTGAQERFFLGILWRSKRKNDRPKRPAETPDLEHKLVDLGFQSLFGSRLVWLD